MGELEGKDRKVILRKNWQSGKLDFNII